MPKASKPRSGSMGVWPRKRSRRIYPRVRSWAALKDPKPLGFAGYKVGMGHLIYTETKKTSFKKGLDIATPFTIVECPPLRIYSVRFYKRDEYGAHASTEILAKPTKDLKRKVNVAKEQKDLSKINFNDYTDLTILVYTQPRLTTIGKKKPELFEMALGGELKDKFEFAKANLDKEIQLNSIFKEGDQLEIHAVTKAYGFQGPVRRFGIGLKHHKSEKGRRAPGSLGGWKAHAHWMYRVAHAGQTGYHTRTDYNKLILKISDDKSINPKSGFHKYGVVKNPYVLIKGSIPGPKKRLIRFNFSHRPNPRYNEAPQIKHMSVRS